MEGNRLCNFCPPSKNVMKNIANKYLIYQIYSIRGVTTELIIPPQNSQVTVYNFPSTAFQPESTRKDGLYTWVCI